MVANATIAGVIMLFVSVTGMTFNVYVMISVLRKKSLRTSFFFLCGSKALYNSVICFTFLIWCTPTALMHGFWGPAEIGSVLGNLAGGCVYLGGMFMQVLASINRIIAAFSLTSYRKYCGIKQTIAVNIITWIFTIGISVLYFLMGTVYYYDADFLIWNVIQLPENYPENDPDAHSGNVTMPSNITSTSILDDIQNTPKIKVDNSKGADQLTSYIIYGLTGFMFLSNAITFSKLFYDTRKNSVLSDVESKKRNRRNKVLLFQKLAQDSLYLIDMFTVQVLAPRYTDWWWQFVTNSLIWLSLNTIDGLVMIMFSKELLDPIKRVRRLLSVSTSDNKELFTRKTRIMSTTTL